MALPAIAGHSYPNGLMLKYNYTLISLKIKEILMGIEVLMPSHSGSLGCPIGLWFIEIMRSSIQALHLVISTG